MRETVFGYKMSLEDPDSGRWMWCGSTLDEILNCVDMELRDRFSAGDHLDGVICLTPVVLPKEQVEKLPEFTGWQGEQ